MSTKEKSYRVTIEAITSETESTQALQFEFQDREDVFALVENLKQGSGLAENDATKLGLGLRLIGPLMMQQRKHPLFIDFMPHFKDFMINLKATVKAKLSGA